MKPNLEKVCNRERFSSEMQISITMPSPKKEQTEASEQTLRHLFAMLVLITAKQRQQTRSPLTEVVKSIQPR